MSAELEKLAKTPKGRQRQIQVNQTWNYYKERIKETLSSEEGQAIYRRRKYDVEPVFGRMKRDFGVRRTHLRGQKSVENDIGLLLMTMNLEKLGKMVTKLGLNNLKNRKIRLQILGNLKIWSRIIFLKLEIVSFFPASFCTYKDIYFFSYNFL